VQRGPADSRTVVTTMVLLDYTVNFDEAAAVVREIINRGGTPAARVVVEW